RLTCVVEGRQMSRARAVRRRAPRAAKCATAMMSRRPGLRRWSAASVGAPAHDIENREARREPRAARQESANDVAGEVYAQDEAAQRDGQYDDPRQQIRRSATLTTQIEHRDQDVRQHDIADR